MNRSIWPKEFDPGADYEVARPFKFGGREFKPPEPFDVKTSPRQLQIMYGSRFIRMVEKPPVEIAAGVGTSTNGSTAKAVGETPKLKLSKRSGGWYDVVDSSGKPVNEKGLRIGDAEKLIAKSKE